MEAPDKPKILVVQTAFLGDVVLVTPLLAALRARFPASYIAFMGTPAEVEIIRGLPGVDEYIAYDKKGAEKGLAGFLSKAKEIKAANFDLAVSAHRSTRTAALLWFSGIKTRIGFAASSFPWLYNHRVPRDPAKHEAIRNMALLGPLGAPENFDPKITLPDPGPPPAETAARGNGPRVGICPGSVWPTKRWPAPGFVKAAHRLIEEAGAEIYLLGSEADREVAEAVTQALGGRAINLAGQTDLRNWVNVISAMDLVITNDSSPTHIASALGVPVVVLFGPTTPAQGFAPFGNHGRVVEVRDLACRPCGEHGARRCPEGHFKCMQWLMPDEVVSASLALLSEKSS